jgi:hypothetical protein
MTGYITKTEPYVEDLDKNLVAMEKLEAVAYVVNDAKRIGYDRPLVVNWEDKALVAAVEKCTLWLASSLDSRLTMRLDMAPFNRTDYLRYTNHRLGTGIVLTNTSSLWTFGNDTRSLPSPGLNITSYVVRNSTTNITIWNLPLHLTLTGCQGNVYPRHTSQTT